MVEMHRGTITLFFILLIGKICTLGLENEIELRNQLDKVTQKVVFDKGSLWHSHRIHIGRHNREGMLIDSG